MPLKKYETELRIALSAVRTATDVCRNIRAAISPDVLEKKDRSPVTVADFASQAVICRLLNQSFPDDSIVAEEDSAQLATAGNQSFLDRIDTELKRVGHDVDADAIRGWIDLGGSQPNQNRFWTLDPIDGTKGFLRGGQYVVALALLINLRVDVAVLGCPNLRPNSNDDGQLGTLFYAVRGEGCWATALDDKGDPVPMCVSETAEVSQARFCESVEAGHSDHGIAANVAASLGISAPPVRMDSQAKYAAVARGDADIYMRLPTRADYREKIWDHAAGSLIVEEAGGRVTDVAGKPLDWTRGRELSANRGVIVSNGRLHNAVIAALREAGVGSGSAENRE